MFDYPALWEEIGYKVRDGQLAKGQHVVHPMGNLTLGDVKERRIPVSAPLIPRWFIEFILRHFYQTKKYNFINNERKLMHMIVPY